MQTKYQTYIDLNILPETFKVLKNIAYKDGYEDGFDAYTELEKDEIYHMLPHQDANEKLITYVIFKLDKKSQLTNYTLTIKKSFIFYWLAHNQLEII